MPKAARAQKPQGKSMSKPISLEELRDLLASSNAPYLLEILSPEQYARQHLPGAHNLPLLGLDQALARVAPDRDVPIVTYCSGPTCKNSLIAARRLLELGYRDVRVFTGGKAAWQEAGYRFESGAEATVTTPA
jgi:rhodanese-related sulfurtransferase